MQLRIHSTKRLLLQQRRSNHKLQPLVFLYGAGLVVAVAVPTLLGGTAASALMIHAGYAPISLPTVVVTTAGSFIGMAGSTLFWTSGVPIAIIIVIVLLVMTVPITIGYVVSRLYEPAQKKQIEEVRE